MFFQNIVRQENIDIIRDWQDSVEVYRFTSKLSRLGPNSDRMQGKATSSIRLVKPEDPSASTGR